MFMKLNDDIVDAKCDFGNIISPKGKDTRSVYKWPIITEYFSEKPFVRFTEFDVADEIKETVIGEFNKYSEIFQFKDNAGEETTEL